MIILQYRNNEELWPNYFSDYSHLSNLDEIVNCSIYLSNKLH